MTPLEMQWHMGHVIRAERIKEGLDPFDPQFDLDGDGKVTPHDIEAIERCILEQPSPPPDLWQPVPKPPLGEMTPMAIHCMRLRSGASTYTSTFSWQAGAPVRGRIRPAVQFWADYYGVTARIYEEKSWAFSVFNVILEGEEGAVHAVERAIRAREG